MTETPHDVLMIRGRVPPRQIGYLNAQLDACEGIAVIRTINSQEGRVIFWVAPDLLDDFYRFAEAMRQEFPLELGAPCEPERSSTDDPA